MEEKKLDISKQVYLIFGLVLFAFVNVFIFDDKVGIGFSVFSTLTLLTIGLLSNRTSLRVLGIVSYVVNVIVAIFGFNYLGWLTGVQAIELIFVVWYLYPKDTFLKTDATDKFTYRYRWQQLMLILAVTVGIYVGFKIASSLWNGSFLEYGGNTAFIFGIQYFLYTALAKSRANEESSVENLKQAAKTLEEIKARAVANPPLPAKKPLSQTMATNTFVKFAGIWLVVMDLSILSYVIRPNDIGFGIGAFFVLLSIVVSLFVKTVEDKNDVFSVIYHKIRPVQPVFFIILLIAHAHKFSYGAAYALLFAAVYFVWAINKINMKTLLTLTILIYFLPIFGYISNPYRLGAKNINDVVQMIIGKGDVDFFKLGNWLDFTPDYLKENNQEIKDEAAELAEEAANFTSTVTLDENDTSEDSGVLNNHEFDLSLNYDVTGETIRILASGTYEELVLEDLSSKYDSMKDISPEEGDRRYKDYYLMGQVESNYGTYRVYLEMDDEWIEDYKEKPANVSYKILILGSDVSLKTIGSTYFY